MGGVVKSPLERPAALAIKQLDDLEVQISRADTFANLDAASRTAQGLQVAFRPVKDVSDRAGEVWCSAEIKLADELAKIPKATGTRGQLKSAGPGRGKKTSGPKPAPPVSDAPTLADMGISKKRAARAKKLAALPASQRMKIIKTLKQSNKAVTPDAILQAQRTENKQAKRDNIAAAVFSSEGPFGTIVIDPPWQMAKIDRDIRPNQDAFDYPTMSVEELRIFFASDISPKLDVDCHLFMWTTEKWLPHAIEMLPALGFKYLLTMVWHKAGGFQPVGLPQYNCEFVIYARKGAPVFVETKDFPCCFDGDRREHSRKPDRFYEIIRRVTGGSRIDVFSREQRDGFAQYGNEIAKFTEAA